MIQDATVWEEVYIRLHLKIRKSLVGSPRRLERRRRIPQNKKAVFPIIYLRGLGKKPEFFW